MPYLIHQPYETLQALEDDFLAEEPAFGEVEEAEKEQKKSEREAKTNFEMGICHLVGLGVSKDVQKSIGLVKSAVWIALLGTPLRSILKSTLPIFPFSEFY